MLNKGVSPQSVWDALLSGAAEMVMRRPDIVSLHAATTSNAMRYCYEASGDNDTRLRLLLQNAAFIPLFRSARGGKLEGPKIDELDAAAKEEVADKAAGDGDARKASDGAGKAAGQEALADIFAHVGRDRMAAARKTLAYLKSNPDPKPLIDTARRLIFLKGTNSHDYKYSSAVLEDYQHVSQPLRAGFIAASTFLLRGSRDKDSDLPKRTRAALA